MSGASLARLPTSCSRTTWSSTSHPSSPLHGPPAGREEVRQLFGEFDAAWAEHKSEPEEFRVLDDDRVNGRLSGIDGAASKPPGSRSSRAF